MPRRVLNRRRFVVAILLQARGEVLKLRVQLLERRDLALLFLGVLLKRAHVAVGGIHDPRLVHAILLLTVLVGFEADHAAVLITLNIAHFSHPQLVPSGVA